jgi:hypothetical protein
MLANAGIIRLMELDYAKDVKLAIAFSELYVSTRSLCSARDMAHYELPEHQERWNRVRGALARVDELTTAKV